MRALRWSTGLVAALSLAGCKCGREPEPVRPEMPEAATPRVVLSQQPWRKNPDGLAPVPSGSPSTLDGREEAAGYRMHADAANGCNGDKKCLVGRCGPLCTEWMSKNSPTTLSANRKNEIYFGCLGACLAGPDAGK